MTISGGGAHRRRSARRCAAPARRGHGIRGLRRKLPAVARCAASTAPRLRLISCRHEAGAAVMAEASAQVDRPARRVPRVAGPGRMPRDNRPAHGLPGCDAALGHAGRPGAADAIWSGKRSRRSSIGECSARSPNGSRRSTRSNAFRSSCTALSASLASGRPGPVVLVLPEDMLEDCTTATDCPPAPLAHAYPGPLRARDDARASVGGGTPHPDRRWCAVDRCGVRGNRAIRLERMTSRSAAATGGSISSRRITIASWASSPFRRITRSCDGCARRTWSSPSERGCPSRRPRITRCSRCPFRAPDSFTSIRRRRRSGSVYRPDACNPVGSHRVLASGGGDVDRRIRCRDRRGARSFDRFIARTARRLHRRKAFNPAEAMSWLAGPLAGRCDRHVRRWRFHWLAAAIPVLRAAWSRPCSHQWRDELRLARGHCREPRPSRPRRCRMRRRRRLHDG